jgi:hypothetical protein
MQLAVSGGIRRVWHRGVELPRRGDKPPKTGPLKQAVVSLASTTQRLQHLRQSCHPEGPAQGCTFLVRFSVCAMAKPSTLAPHQEVVGEAEESAGRPTGDPYSGVAREPTMT